jgi:hypothetical protein
MNSRCLRAFTVVLLGVSVSIVPVRPHYGLATRHDSPGSTLTQRKQQRVRNVSLRATFASRVRTAAPDTETAVSNRLRRRAASDSLAAALAPSARLPIRRLPSRPLRC